MLKAQPRWRAWIEVGLGLAVITSSADALTSGAGPVFAQSVRWLGQDQEGATDQYLLSFSSLSLWGRDWSLRTSLSWLSQTSDLDPSAPDVHSGPGAVYITLGRAIWGGVVHPGLESRGWVRLRSKLPLQSELSTLGTGEFDWGASIYAANRSGPVRLLGEAGFTAIGDPPGTQYSDVLDIWLSASYKMSRAAVFPLVGITGSAPMSVNDHPFGEWSVGVGIPVYGGLSASVLYSRGLATDTPRTAITLIASLGFDWFGETVQPAVGDDRIGSGASD